MPSGCATSTNKIKFTAPTISDGGRRLALPPPGRPSGHARPRGRRAQPRARAAKWDGAPTLAYTYDHQYSLRKRWCARRRSPPRRRGCRGWPAGGAGARSPRPSSGVMTTPRQPRLESSTSRGLRAPALPRSATAPRSHLGSGRSPWRAGTRSSLVTASFRPRTGGWEASGWTRAARTRRASCRSDHAGSGRPQPDTWRSRLGDSCRSPEQARPASGDGPERNTSASLLSGQFSTVVAACHPCVSAI